MGRRHWRLLQTVILFAGGLDVLEADLIVAEQSLGARDALYQRHWQRAIDRTLVVLLITSGIETCGGLLRGWHSRAGGRAASRHRRCGRR